MSTCGRSRRVMWRATTLLLAIASPVLAQVPPPPTPPPPPPPPPPVAAQPMLVTATGTAVLAGTVIADDGSGRQVRRATVTIRSARLPDRMLLSDDEGRFAFTGLPPGTYSITVRKPGWITGYHGARVSWTAPGTPVALRDGDRRMDVELRLPPGGVITGRLVDELGQPQTGARVIAFRRERHAGRDTFAWKGAASSVTRLTDDRGEFRISELPPGDYIVGANIIVGPVGSRPMTTVEEIRWAEQVRRGGFAGAGPAPPRGAAMDYQPIYYPGVVDAARAEIVSLDPGEERSGVDFQLGFVRSVTVSGTLRLPDGGPAPGVPVHLMPPDGHVVADAFLASVRRTVRSGRDGAFAIESVPPGEHVLVARGTLPASSREPGGGGSASPAMLWADERFSVASADLEGLDITLQPGLTISGRLAFTGASAEPPENLEDIALGVLPADGGGVSLRVPSVPAAPDGTFEIGGLAPGRYILTLGFPGAGRPGGPTWLSSRAVIDGRNALEVPFDLVAARPLEDVVVELTDRPAELTGVVTDAGGRPVAGLTMVVFPAEQANWAVSADQRARRTAALDDRGRFVFDAMPAGDYYLAALADPASADLADPAYLAQLAASAVRVELALGERTVQDIRLGGG